MKDKAKNVLEEYKKFALKGNILDLAIAVIIGNAFSRITQSLVNNIIMPLLSLLIGDIHFSDLKIVFKAATETTQEVALGYGTFLQVTLEFLIVSFSIFIVYRLLTRVRKIKEREVEEEIIAEEQLPPEKTNEEKIIDLLTEIKDRLHK